MEDPTKQYVQQYEWSVMELIDQMVRDTTGGRMKASVESGAYEAAYLKQRYGDVFAEFLDSDSPPGKRRERGWRRRIRRTLAKSPVEWWYALFRVVKLAWWRGDPRRTREANKWMHDRLSLRLLLEEAGFGGFTQKTAMDSDIENWERYHFDVSHKGAYDLEPSLYVECRKPGGATSTS